MLVAIPTAMPVAPLTSRLGNAAGQHLRLALLAVVVGAEVDDVLVEAPVMSIAAAARRHSV